MFYEGRRHTTTNVSFSFGTWGRSRRIFTCIWHSKQGRINSLKFEKASLPSPPTATGAAGQREHFNIDMAFRTSVASSRLSDSSGMTRKWKARENMSAWSAKRRLWLLWCRPSSLQFPPVRVFALSQLSRSLGQASTIMESGRILNTFCETCNVTLRLWTTGTREFLILTVDIDIK